MNRDLRVCNIVQSKIMNCPTACKEHQGLQNLLLSDSYNLRSKCSCGSASPKELDASVVTRLKRKQF